MTVLRRIDPPQVVLDVSIGSPRERNALVAGDVWAGAIASWRVRVSVPKRQDEDPDAAAEIRRRVADRLGRRIMWSRHGIAELANEGWVRRAVEKGLESCTVIENYPAVHRPLPDCLVLAWLRADKPLHAVVAIDEPNDRLFMVTVYTPSPEEWEHDWKTRKC